MTGTVHVQKPEFDVPVFRPGWRRWIFNFLTNSVSRPTMRYDTVDTIYLCYRLDEKEVDDTRAALPPGYTLCNGWLGENESSEDYWIWCQLYWVTVSNLQSRARCGINTFVKTPWGRCGTYMFQSSPFISSAHDGTILSRYMVRAEGWIANLYGSGNLAEVDLKVGANESQVVLAHDHERMEIRFKNTSKQTTRFTPQALEHVELAIYEHGQVFDEVTFNHVLATAQLQKITKEEITSFESTFQRTLRRKPDTILFFPGSSPFFVFPYQRPPA